MSKFDKDKYCADYEFFLKRLQSIEAEYGLDAVESEYKFSLELQRECEDREAELALQRAYGYVLNGLGSVEDTECYCGRCYDCVPRNGRF